jgi:Elongation factor P, C-terminal
VNSARRRVFYTDSPLGKVTNGLRPRGHQNTWKEARLENGVQIRVPLFIALGETIRIDLKTGRYLERVRGEMKKGT